MMIPGREGRVGLLLVVLAGAGTAYAQREEEAPEEVDEPELPRRRVRRVLPPDEAAAAALASKDPRAALRLRFVEDRIRGANAFRGTGIALTAVGGAVMATGVGLTVYAYTAGPYSLSSSTRGSIGAAGPAVLVLGLAAAGVGIPLWVTGHVRYKKYDDQRERLLFGAMPVPGGGGAQVGGSF